MLGVLMMGMIIGCGGDDGIDNDDDEQELLWPIDICNESRAYPSYYVSDLSDFYSPFIRFDTDLDGSPDRPELLVYQPNQQNQGTYYKLIEIKDKKMRVERVIINLSTAKYDGTGEYFTLCTNYTLNNGVLTFSGGDVPVISDTTWYKKNL